MDYSQYLPKLIIGLIGHFNDPNPGVVDAAWHALNAVTEVKDVQFLFSKISRF